MLTQFKFQHNNLLSDRMMDAQIAEIFNLPKKSIQPEKFQPNLDVFESKNAYQLMFALPGFQKENLKIEIDKNYLLLQGERHLNASENETKQHLLESFYGKFSRKIQLPEQININSLEAEFKDGILTISIPKTELKQNKSQVVIR